MGSAIRSAGMAGILLARTAPGIAYLPERAFANTLTRLIPDIYAALDVVSRELVGFLPSVARDVSAERAAVGESIVYQIAPSMIASDVVPAMQVPEPPDVNIGNNTMTISKARRAAFGFTGEEQKGLNNGPGYISVQAGLIAQSLRTLVNEAEGDLALEAANNASRAYGTAGTTPFGSGNLADEAFVRKILDDNGAPATGRALILNKIAGATLRTINNLTRVNEAGSSMTLRDGELLNIYGMSNKESNAIVNHVAGTAAGATTNAAGYAVGATVITLAAAGTGTIVAGDVITFAGDTNKYVVASGNGNVAAGGTITLAKPGLRVAKTAAAIAITVSTSFAANVAFSSNALIWAARAPAMPVEGDLRLDSRIITDPRSGVSFEMSIWPGYRKVEAEVALAWGVKATKQEHIALLVG